MPTTEPQIANPPVSLASDCSPAFFDRDGVTIYNGDCRTVLASLPSESVHCCVTSPPYWNLRDYKNEMQIGMETTPDEYVAELVAVFHELRRVLRDDGTLWLNLGDSYIGGGRGGGGGGGSFADERPGWIDTPPLTGESRSIAKSIGLKPKDLVGIPWRVAFALQADGWYLRQDIIWAKPNPMPESVQDRCTKSHEYVFLLSKSQRYHFAADAIAEPAAYAGQMRGGSTNRYEQNAAGMDCKIYDTRNKRSVWTVGTRPYNGAHFATFPPELIEPCIRASCPDGGTVLDPFLGSGTTAEVARRHGCRCVGIELNAEYAALAAKRFRQRSLLSAT